MVWNQARAQSKTQQDLLFSFSQTLKSKLLGEQNGQASKDTTFASF